MLKNQSYFCEAATRMRLFFGLNLFLPNLDFVLFVVNFFVYLILRHHNRLQNIHYYHLSIC